MKRYIYKAMLFTIFLHPLISFAHEKNAEGELQMFNAMVNGDLETFKELLDNGIDPIEGTDSNGFRTSSFCESTKVGNEEYFDLIVVNEELVHYLSVIGTSYGSPITCAISYDNFPIYLKLLSLGVDVNAVQNSGAADDRLFLRPLAIALKNRTAKFAWDILQRIEVSDVQIDRLVRFANGNPGIEGRPKQMYRQKIIQWLIDRGIEVNPKHPGRREGYESK